MRIFRRIRQILLDDGKLRKYFFYAFGEIILVVLGILIALQINEWNEDRKDLELRRVYIESITEELQENLRRFQIIDQLAVKDIVRLREGEAKVQNAENPQDALIDYVRNEFDGALPGNEPLGTNTLSVLISTGDIKLFPPDLAGQINNLKSLFDNYDYARNTITDSYVAAYSRLSQRFSIPDDVLSLGVKLENVTWDDPDTKTLAILLKETMGWKLVYWNAGMEIRDNLEEKTNKLIQSLSELED